MSGSFASAGLKRNAAYRRLSRGALAAALPMPGIFVWLGSGAPGSNGGLVESRLIVVVRTPAYLVTRVIAREPRPV